MQGRSYLDASSGSSDQMTAGHPVWDGSVPSESIPLYTTVDETGELGCLTLRCLLRCPSSSHALGDAGDLHRNDLRTVGTYMSSCSL